MRKFNEIMKRIMAVVLCAVVALNSNVIVFAEREEDILNEESSTGTEESSVVIEKSSVATEESYVVTEESSNQTEEKVNNGTKEDVKTVSAARTFLTVVDGVEIEVIAPEGAFDRPSEKIYMTAVALSEEQREDVVKILEAQAASRGEVLVEFYAYDINLWADAACTEKIQPLIPVTVNYKNVDINTAIADSVRMTSIDEVEQTVTEVNGKIEGNMVALEIPHFTVGVVASFAEEGDTSAKNSFIPTLASEIQVSKDGLFRYQKNVIPTGVENEFLIYLNVEPRMEWSWETFLSRSTI